MLWILVRFFRCLGTMFVYLSSKATLSVPRDKEEEEAGGHLDHSST